MSLNIPSKEYFLFQLLDDTTVRVKELQAVIFSYAWDSLSDLKLQSSAPFVAFEDGTFCIDRSWFCGYIGLFVNAHVIFALRFEGLDDEERLILQLHTLAGDNSFILTSSKHAESLHREGYGIHFEKDGHVLGENENALSLYAFLSEMEELGLIYYSAHEFKFDFATCSRILEALTFLSRTVSNPSSSLNERKGAKVVACET